ncbi:MAG: hypothetical protein HKL86_03500 [Acidimicrobiaceae bacterium]|nr:hypothetical protein [Acidimicrobiaceae bacterium]
MDRAREDRRVSPQRSPVALRQRALRLMAMALVLVSSLLASTPGFAAGSRPSAPRLVHAVAGVGSVVISFERPCPRGAAPFETSSSR